MENDRSIRWFARWQVIAGAAFVALVGITAFLHFKPTKVTNQAQTKPNVSSSQESNQKEAPVPQPQPQPTPQSSNSGSSTNSNSSSTSVTNDSSSSVTINNSTTQTSSSGSNSVTINSVSSSVAANTKATLDATTTPGGLCTIHISGNYSQAFSKKAGADGKIHWEWQVGYNKGTFDVTVTCGSASSSTSITVN